MGISVYVFPEFGKLKRVVIVKFEQLSVTVGVGKVMLPVQSLLVVLIVISIGQAITGGVLSVTSIA